MRKEMLIEKKREIVKDMIWQLRDTITDDDLRMFSRDQLTTIAEIFKKADQLRDSKNPFFTLSATEVMQKESGKIALFDECGFVREESHEECKTGASAPILEKWEREKG